MFLFSPSPSSSSSCSFFYVSSSLLDLLCLGFITFFNLCCCFVAFAGLAQKELCAPTVKQWAMRFVLFNPFFFVLFCTLLHTRLLYATALRTLVSNIDSARIYHQGDEVNSWFDLICLLLRFCYLSGLPNTQSYSCCKKVSLTGAKGSTVRACLPTIIGAKRIATYRGGGGVRVSVCVVR